jgi:putative Mn2+ efflux pump MntP
VPPLYWRRKEPIGAVVLVALGVLLLLNQFDIFNGRLLEFSWPLVLIGLGVWLIVRRLASQGGSK